MGIVQWRPALCGLSFACLVASAAAQSAGDPIPASKLVNVDTTWVPAPNRWEVRASARSFRGAEKIAYGDAELSLGLSAGFGLTFAGSLGDFTNFATPDFTIRHGGDDLEALLKWDVPCTNGLMIAGGVSLPNTPAEKNAFGVAEAAYKFSSRQADLYLGGKGVFRGSRNIDGLYGGLDVRLIEGLDFVGDFTLVLNGKNTYNTATGDAQRRNVYGAGLRFSPTMHGNTPRVTFDLGVTNGIGGTTGFSLTPALGNTMGVYVAVAIRY